MIFNIMVLARGQQAILRLQFEDGNAQEYVLSYENQKLYLNSNRYFWTRVEEGHCW